MTSLAVTGRGEFVEDVEPPLPLDTPLFLIKPEVGLSTPLIFKALDLSRRSTGAWRLPRSACTRPASSVVYPPAPLASQPAPKRTRACSQRTPGSSWTACVPRVPSSAMW